MSVPDDVMASTTTCCSGAELDPQAHPNEAKRTLARRLVERFHGRRARRGGVALRPGARAARGAGGRAGRSALEPGGGRGGAPAGADRGRVRDLSSEARRLIQQGGVRLDGEAVAPDAAGHAGRRAGRAGAAGGPAAVRAPGRPCVAQARQPRSAGATRRASAAPRGRRACFCGLYWMVALEADRARRGIPLRRAGRSLKTEQRVGHGRLRSWPTTGPTRRRRLWRGRWQPEPRHVACRRIVYSVGKSGMTTLLWPG